MLRQSLPLECLLVILHLLSRKHDTGTMTRLLRVNKAFCATTLPFLYGDCFSLRIHLHQFRSITGSTTTTFILMIRTLLLQVEPRSRIPEILRVAFFTQDGQNEYQPPPPPVFKYGHFIRKVVPEHNFNTSLPLIVRRDSPVMDYAATHHLFDKYVAEGLLPNDIHEDCRDLALYQALRIDIHCQLMWTLFEDNLETIQEFAIPLADVERYMDHVNRLASLSKVGFLSVNKAWPFEFKHTTIMREDMNRRAREREDMRNHSFRSMIQFVRQHTSTHKNVLRDAEVPPIERTRQHSHSDVHFEILALLPPLQNPRSVDHSNKLQFLARLEDTNLNYVESIMLRKEDMSDYEAERIYGSLSGRPQFLSRCRALKKLDMDTLGPDMFQWAVLEKKQRDEAQKQESAVGQHLTTGQHGYYNHNDAPLISLVPLQSINITNAKRSTMTQEVGDIGFAFSDSLEEFNMNACLGYDIDGEDEEYGGDEGVDLANTPQAAYGQGWNLPRLQALSLYMNSFQLHVDMDGLQRCSVLESLFLNDNIAAYNYREVRSWPPVNLPHLKCLDLGGSPALHFNMDSLHDSPGLEHLTWNMPLIILEGGDEDEDEFHHIPSPEELENGDPGNQGPDGHEVSGMLGPNQGYQSIGRRPRYSWDWYLPNLQELELSAVFAFLFDFQWLQHLPSLQRLALYIRSPLDNPHERHITLKDLSRGQRLQDQNESRSEVILDQYISLPHLDTLKLDGHWILEEKVLGVLCLFVAPNLSRVDFKKGCKGYTLREWIPLARKMPRIKAINLGLHLWPCEIQAAGLIPQSEILVDQLHKGHIVYGLRNYSFYHDVAFVRPMQ